MAILRVSTSAGAFQSISSALMRSQAGDTILVSGTYRENLIIPHSVEMRAETPGSRFTVLGSISINTAGTRFVLNDCDVRQSAQSGITVSNGADALLTQCVLSSHSKHGVQVLENGNITATNCTFSLNAEVGLFVLSTATARVENCLFSKNSHSGVAVGSHASIAFVTSDLAENGMNGLWLNPNAKATIQGGAVYGNKSGAIAAKTGHVEVRACKIHDGLGAGIDLEEHSTATIEECVFAGNAGVGIVLTMSEAVVRESTISNHGCSGIFVQNASAATIENCEISGGGENYPGIFIKGSKATVTYCRVHDTKSVGILFEEGAKGTIERSQCWKNATDGIQVLSDANVEVRHTRSSENASRGFQVSSAKLTLEQCEVWGGGKEYAGILAAGARFLMRNCSVHHTNGHGVKFQGETTAEVEECDIWSNAGTGICVEGKSEVRIRRTKSHTNNEYGILIEGASNGTIEESECWGGPPDYAGIMVSGAKAFVHDCRVHHTKSCGIRFFGQANGVIEQTESWSNAAAGIWVEVQSEVLIRANKVHENGTNGILVLSNSNVTIEDCESWSGGESYPGIAVGNATALVRNCRVHDIKSQGISFRDKSKGSIEQCTVWDSLVGGIGIGQNSDVLIRACTIQQNAQCGIWAYDNAKCKIEECTIRENTGPGIIAQNSNVDVIGGRVNNNKGAGFLFREHATGSVDKHCVIEGNSEGGYFNDGTASFTVLDSALPPSMAAKISESPAKSTPVKNAKTELDQATEELQHMVGLQEVKNALRDVKALLTLEKGDISKLEGLHCLFLGGPGTGKTTVAKLMGKILHKMKATRTDNVVVVDRPRQQLVAPYRGQSAERTQQVIEQALGGVLFIDEAYSIVQEDGDSFGPEAINTLVPALENHKNDFVVIAAGYPARMNDFLSANPGLKDRFRRRFIFEDYKPAELMEIFARRLSDHNLNIEDKARTVVEQEFKARYDARDEEFGNARMVRNFLADAHQNLARRLLGPGSIQQAGGESRTLTYADVAPLCTSIPPNPRPESEIMAELNQLIGLSSLKKKIVDVIHTIRFEQRTADPSRGFEPPRLHSLFLGSPGTGKTTVARLLGQVYLNMGLLSRGHVVDASPSELKAKWRGHTAPNVKKKVKESLGGIFFLDEAYNLVSGKDDEYGHEALTVIMMEMENRKPGQFVVIAAGYQKEMSEFLESNSGLASRFPPRFNFHFDDYSPAELVQILDKFVAEKKFTYGSGVQERAFHEFETAWQERGPRFSNGRAVRNYFEEVISKLASRVNRLPHDTPTNVLRTIAVEDLGGLSLDRGNPRGPSQGKNIGFT